jgi:hypothetical protein
MAWSVLGSALILFVTYFQVQISVAINNWYGPFYDLIQTALSKSAPVTIGQFYGSSSPLPRSPSWRSRSGRSRASSSAITSFAGERR